MIIFESEGAKKIILVILVTFFTALIAWQWVSSEPFANVDVENNFLAQVGEEVGDSATAVKDSFTQGVSDTKNINEELAKQVKQQQLIEETKKYLEDKKNDILVSPSTKEECDAREGKWDEEKAICNLLSTDAGVVCSDSSECQGYCVVDLPEIYNKFISEGRSVESTGFCSENILQYGCLAIVEEGWVHKISCIN